MKLLKEFTAMLCGSFDNSVQLERFAAQGITGYPEARHVNTRINDHIDHLPEDFAGEFVLEESYYTVGSESMFTPVLKFSLYERFSNEVLEVSESMEKDGRRTFGYDLPLEYRRTGC